MVGRLAAAAVPRALPSGDEVVSWRLVVERPAGSTPSSDTVNCSAFGARVRGQALGWEPGEVIEVSGAAAPAILARCRRACRTVTRWTWSRRVGESPDQQPGRGFRDEQRRLPWHPVTGGRDRGDVGDRCRVQQEGDAAARHGRLGGGSDIVVELNDRPRVSSSCHRVADQIAVGDRDVERPPRLRSARPAAPRPAWSGSGSVSSHARVPSLITKAAPSTPALAS